MFDGNSIV